MKKHNSVPNMRFSGFEDEWKDKKLGKITKYVKGFAFESKLYTEDGIRIIKVTDLTNKKIKNENGSSTYISETMATKFKKYIIHQKDIIITTVGSKTKLKSSSVGRAIYIDMCKNYLLNQNLVKLTALSGFDSFFIYSQLEQPKYINYISKIERGNANQANIEIKDLWNYIVKASSIKEQQKIGNFFAKLDKLLDLQQQKIDKLELLKKALLQKLFPKHDTKIPELRFKGYKEDWRDKKTLELVSERNSKIIPNDEYPLKAFIAKKGISEKGEKYNRSFLVKSRQKKYKKTEYGDLIYSSNNLEVGSIGINRYGNACISPVYSIFKVNNSLTYDFLGYLIQRKEFIFNMIRYRQGVTYGQWKIHESDFLNIQVLVPETIDEQQKIGNLLSKVDQLIELENKKLQNFQQVKKCLLQNMFVE